MRWKNGSMKSFLPGKPKHIVNLRMIEKIEPYFNGGLLLELHGGEKIEASHQAGREVQGK